MILPIQAIAAESYLYSGIDLATTKSQDNYDSADALVAFGLNAGINRHDSIVMEVGMQKRDRIEGVVLRGSLMYRHALYGRPNYSPFVSGGISRIELNKKSCDYEIKLFPSGAYYDYICTPYYSSSNGGIIEAGINIKRARNSYFTVKISSYKGSKNTVLNMLSFGGSF